MFFAECPGRGEADVLEGQMKGKFINIFFDYFISNRGKERKRRMRRLKKEIQEKKEIEEGQEEKRKE